MTAESLSASRDVAADLERQVREYLLELMPIEHAPAHLRLAFHDAGTFELRSHTGGADGSIRLLDEVRRAENTGWGQACLELLTLAKEDFPSVSWADLIAVGAAAAIQKSGGPIIEIGLGRVDATEPAPRNRLPGGYEGGALLKRVFASKGLSARDVVALTGAHTLGHVQTHPFTSDHGVFSNSYFVHLLSRPVISLLPTDHALVEDPELRSYVEVYAQDEQRFFADFADAFRRLTWLGQATPATTASS